MYNQDDFLNRVQKLAVDKGTNLKQVTREIGIANSAFTDWKKGRGIPNIERFCLIAEYFGVSLDYLAYGKPDTVMLEFSNRQQTELNDKYNRLSPELQGKVISYIDGMLAALGEGGQEQLRLSV